MSEKGWRSWRLPRIGRRVEDKIVRGGFEGVRMKWRLEEYAKKRADVQVGESRGIRWPGDAEGQLMCTANTRRLSVDGRWLSPQGAVGVDWRGGVLDGLRRRTGGYHLDEYFRNAMGGRKLIVVNAADLVRLRFGGVCCGYKKGPAGYRPVVYGFGGVQKAIEECCSARGWGSITARRGASDLSYEQSLFVVCPE